MEVEFVFEKDKIVLRKAKGQLRHGGLTVELMALLTRDARRYRTYFPRLTLIAPGRA